MSPLNGKVARIVGAANAPSIAFCPADDLHGRVTDCSRKDFAQAMDISVHSLIRVARLAEPLMVKGGTILTMTYYGGEKVVDHSNFMGPVKSALEGTVRAPGHALVTIADVGAVAVVLASDGASRISGDITYVDGGLHVHA